MSGAIEVKNLTKSYFQRLATPQTGGKVRRQKVWAVNDVSFSLERSEVLGLIGESGCGKSTLGRLLINLESPTSGSILIDGKDSQAIYKKNSLQFRRMIQTIFQNPFDTFDPRYTVKKVLMETLAIHHIGNTEEEREKICIDRLEKAGLIPAKDFLDRFTFELSGGQLQRISILRSMLLEPMFVVADEPVSMLDVSVRADIVNMLIRFCKENRCAMVFISHDISTTRMIAQRLAVMYLGRIVEIGPTEEILRNPMHPYTRALISNCAQTDPRVKPHRIQVTGEPPTPVNPGPGCFFSPRCYCCKSKCKEGYPEMQDVGNGHFVSCYYPQKEAFTY